MTKSEYFRAQNSLESGRRGLGRVCLTRIVLASLFEAVAAAEEPWFPSPSLSTKGLRPSTSYSALVRTCFLCG